MLLRMRHVRHGVNPQRQDVFGEKARTLELELQTGHWCIRSCDLRWKELLNLRS